MTKAGLRWTVLRSHPDSVLELRWKECLANADYPAGLMMPEYLQEPNEGGNRFAVLAMTEEHVMGVLTGIREGTRLSSGQAARPQVCCRAASDKDQVALALASGLRELWGDAKLITLHSWTPMPGFEQAGYRMRPSSGEHGLIMLDLAEGPDRLFAGFSQTRRNEIRQAIKAGVEVTTAAAPAELQEFYEIFVGWCKRKGVPPTSYETMVRELAEEATLFLAKLEGKILAGSAFRSCPGGIAEYSANFSGPESQPYKANGLLVWRGIEWAHREGHRFFSLGAAHPFLQRFGGQYLTTYRYQVDRTLIRSYELKEALVRLRTQMARPLPVRLRKAIKRVLGMNR